MKTTLTILFTILIAVVCHSECPIECYCNQYITTCTSNNIQSHFPPALSTYFHPTESTSGDIYSRRLELHNYAVSYVSRDEFHELIHDNLSELSLSRNSIEQIDNDTFLTTRGNQSDDSVSADNVTTSSNEPLQSLLALDLSQNKLNYFVGGDGLKWLKSLDLSSNQLQQVYYFNLLHGLESVNLRDNQLTYLPATTFQNLRSLQYVNLVRNTLSYVHPATFSNLPALAHLILSNNPLSNVLPGFYWNSRVQFIDVSHVGLTHVPTSLTKTIRDLRLANNNLSIIRQTDFESYPNVGLLVLDENVIETIEDDAFGRLEFLSRLWLNGNQLSKIPQNLPPSLRSLQLEGNRVSNISSSDFRNLRLLTELNLHGNKLLGIPSWTFSELSSLEILNLRSNQIDVIYRDSFANLSSLKTLDISQNPIKVFVSGAFTTLTKLSVLLLSRLQEKSIEVDPTCLQPLQNLQTLMLDNSPTLANKLILDSSTTTSLYFLPGSLTELNLQKCELEDVNGVSNALYELSLQIVKLSGNPWDCEDLTDSAFHDLMRRHIIIDEPICSSPSHFKGIPLAQLENVTRSLTTTTESTTATFTNPTTVKSSNFVKLTSSVTNVPNTNSPEKMTHASFSTTSSRPTTSFVKVTLVSDTSNSNSARKVTTTTPELITQSYFDKITSTPSKPQSTSSYFSSTKSKVGMSIEGVGGSTTVTTSSTIDKTKTNDDNAIIDESGRRMSRLNKLNRSQSYFSYHGEEEDLDRETQEPVSRSIDGFPLKLHPDNDVAKEYLQSSTSLEKSHSAGDNNSTQQKYKPTLLYLRSTGQHKDSSDTDVTPSVNGTIILKTLLISALTCLGAVMGLFLLSFLAFRYTRTRYIFHTNNKAEETQENEEPTCSRLSYTRFGLGKNKRKELSCFSSCEFHRGRGISENSQHPTDYMDQVELSGISNKLYFENEDIYHIT